MMKHKLAAALMTASLLGAAAGAAELTGTVTNKTTGKPAANATVILLTLAQGMEESGRTTTDGQGRFRVELKNAQAPHLLRVQHQDVNYHKQVPPGMTAAEVEVYDAAKKVAGVSTSMNILRIEPQGKEVQVMELYAVRNASDPPRTLMDDRTYEINLPPAAVIETALVASSGGMPVNASPIPGKQKGNYGFMFPLRPGETRFQISYRMPYTGSAEFSPKPGGPLEHLVVMLPKSVEFTPQRPEIYSPMPDEDGATLRVATRVTPDQQIAFRVAGAGVFPREAEASAAGGAVAPENRPGGGLGPPINSPNPLAGHMWWILGGFAVLLAAGAYWFYRQPALAEAPPATRTASAPRRDLPARAAGNGRSALLLEALKEELFALETERHAGAISGAEYEKAKAALDHTLERALGRQKLPR